MRRSLWGAIGVMVSVSVTAPALAVTQIGVTSAVLPNARGTPPEQPTRILELGNDMYANEHVQTVENGKVHLLFKDGSALSIGPNSDIVLDRFVYDPETKTGELSMSATKGVFRFVGGRISKTTPVTIKTPNATIGIRGGVGIFEIGETIRAALIFGQELFIQTGGRTFTVNRPGFQLFVAADGTVSAPTAVDSEGLGGPLSQLEGTPDQTGETRNLVPTDIGTAQVANLSSNLPPSSTAPTDGTTPEPAAKLVNDPNFDDMIGIDNATDEIVMQGASGGTSVAGTSGLVGLYRHAFDRDRGSDLNLSLAELLSDGMVGAGFASAQGSSSTLIFPVSTTASGGGAPGAGSYLNFDGASGTDSTFGPISTGRSFVADTGEFAFVFADEINFPGHGAFAFVGTPTPLASYPTSGVFTYDLQRDLFLNGDVPFIGSVHGGALGFSGDTIGIASINWQAVADSLGVLYAGNSAFIGMQEAQKSAASLIVGLIKGDAGGQPFLRGQFRGSVRSSTVATTRTTFLSGTAGTSDASGGNDFFGSAGPTFFNLDSSQVNATDTFLFDGVTSRIGTTVGTTTGPNVPATRASDDVANQTRTPGTFILESGGIAQDWTGSGAVGNFNRFVTPNGGSGSLILGADGTVEATVSVGTQDSGFGAALIRFGGSAGTSAFASDQSFGAIESATSSTVDSSPVNSQLLYFMTLGNPANSGALPANFALCACDYLMAGFWGGQLAIDSATQSEFHLTPWVAGTSVTAADIPMSGTASYSGNTIVQVYNALSGAPGSLYNAAGTMNASVSFSPGTIMVSNLQLSADGATLSLTGSGASPGPVSVTGSGTRGGVGLAGGGQARFAGPDAANIYGSFSAANDGGSYRQSGVFGGTR